LVFGRSPVDKVVGLAKDVTPEERGAFCVMVEQLED
jgi:hypothetical protein